MYCSAVEVLETYQKLKKSLTSFSLVSWEIPLTWTVVDMVRWRGLDGIEMVFVREYGLKRVYGSGMSVSEEAGMLL